MEKQVLRDLYEKYGDGLIFNPKRLRAYLLDMRVPKKTVNLLTDIARIAGFKQFTEEIRDDMSAAEKLRYNTECEYAFDKAAVEFGVDCWTYALTGVSRKVEDEDAFGKEIWPKEKAELVAAALRELLRNE